MTAAPKGWAKALRAAAFGALAAAPLIAIAWYLPALASPQRNLTKALFAAFGLAAVPEEAVKLIALLALALWRRGGQRLVHSGFWLGVGFALTETVYYAAMQGPGLIGLRTLTALPTHAFLGAVMGHYVSLALAWTPERKLLLWLKALAVPALLHGLYDLPFMIEAVTTRDQVDGVVLSAMVLLLLAAWARQLLDTAPRPATA